VGVSVCVSQSTISKQSIFINYVNPTKYFLFHCVDIPQSHSKTLQQPGMEIRMFVVEIVFIQSYRGGAALRHKGATAPLTFYKHILCTET